MNINPISFGSRIPLGRCQIFDNQQNRFVGATFFEYDCKDLDDIHEVGHTKGDVDCKGSILEEMYYKYANNGNSNYSFYSLRSDCGDVVGICSTLNEDKNKQVEYITSSLDGKYKYVGQAMLASLAQNTLNSNKTKLTIHDSIASAWDFYEKVCGFRAVPNCSNLEMNRYEMYKFVQQTQNRTQGKIIDFGI